MTYIVKKKIKKMKVYAIIPARGGSKGIPRKNIKSFKGKPLLYYSIYQAQQSKIFDKIIVSTDDKEIAEVGKLYGATILMRPKDIAGDLSRDYEFMKHAVEAYEECDLWCQLRPTFPLRKIEDIKNAFKEFNPCFTSLRSVIELDFPVHKTYFINNEILCPALESENESHNAPRQILPKSYLHNGCIDIVKKTTILSGSICGNKIQPYIMNKDNNTDIDTMEQWILASKHESMV